VSGVVKEKKNIDCILEVNLYCTFICNLKKWSRMQNNLAYNDFSPNLSFRLYYAGIIGATDLQKSHRYPRPSSQVYAFAKVMLFINPGPIYCVAFIVTPFNKPDATYGVPPVSLRFSIYGA